MKIRIRYFAGSRHAAGVREEELDHPGPLAAGQALAILEERHPSLKELGRSLKLAVGETIVSPEHPLSEGDTLALLPPVSGGSGPVLPVPLQSERACITPEPIRVEALAEELAGRGEGAVATFAGVVRPYEKHCRMVEFLEYEIYPEMAIKTLDQVCQEAQERFPILGIRVAHRFGPIPAGETAVAIAAAAEHRAAAFDACRYAIDRIKEIVPIWKILGCLLLLAAPLAAAPAAEPAPEEPAAGRLRQELWDQGYSAEEIEKRLARFREERQKQAEFQKSVDLLPPPLRDATGEWMQARGRRGETPEEIRQVLGPSLQRLADLREGTDRKLRPRMVLRYVESLELEPAVRRRWLQEHQKALGHLLPAGETVGEKPGKDQPRRWIEQFAEEKREQEELSAETERELQQLRRGWGKEPPEQRAERVERLIRLLVPPPLEALLWRRAAQPQ